MTERIRPIRAYLDTSVFGGVFDEEFADHSLALFERVRGREIVVLVSDVTEKELTGAPPQVKDLLRDIAPHSREDCPVTAEVIRLALTYIERRVIGPKWRDDAIHVAAATLHRADVMVSWNFRHIVRWDRVRAFNAVNRELGYPLVTICSPAEVRYANEDEDI